ncbi:unnamed protein product, partial [Cylicostephanus goldi]
MKKFAEAEALLGTEESRSLLSTPPTFLMARRLDLLLTLDTLKEVVNAEGLSKSRLRGPHLARLELIGRFLKEEEPVRSLLDGMNLGKPIELMVNYVLTFYAKPCCYNDINQYLWLLDDKKKEELIDGLKEFIDSVIHQREQAGEDS